MYILDTPGSTSHLLLLMNGNIKFKTCGGVRNRGAKFTFDQPLESKYKKNDQTL